MKGIKPHLNLYIVKQKGGQIFNLSPGKIKTQL
jgi:hypothetical protein